MTAFAILAAGGAISWLLRIAFIDLLPAKRLPEIVQRALDGVGPAAMAALVATELAHRFHEPSPAQGINALVAILAAGAVAWKTKGPNLAVVAAIASYWLIQMGTA